MPLVRFEKYHGLGNDFVLVDARHVSRWPTARAARRWCDRRRGVGADGVLTLLPSRDPAAALRMHIYNADGSVPEMCGNGLRAVVHYALGGRPGARTVVDTDAGVREGVVEADGRVRVGLGEARLIAQAIPSEVDGGWRDGVGVSMGNPHLVLGPFPPGTDLRALAERAGPSLERHARFPARVNVSFVALTGPASIQDVVYERGAGVTDACGTGAAAAAVAMGRLGVLAARGRITVELLGGPLEVTIHDAAAAGEGLASALGRVEITGEAIRVYAGELEASEEELSAVSAG